MKKGCTVLTIWLAATLLGGICLGQSADDSRKLLDSAEEILATVSELRQLEIKRPVEKGIKSRSEIEAFLIERVNKEYPKEEIEKEERLLERLGLIPEELDLYSFMLELLTEQLAGYYDPYSETFYIADWIPLAIQAPVMAHELTHALQDQHFDLEAYLERIEGNDDSTLARSAIIEGEGLLIMLDYSLRPMGGSSLDIPDIVAANRSQMAMMEAQFQVFASAPNYLRETLLFPYTYGARFLQEVVRKHSWFKVNEIYDDLPTSTEQILHPAKYLGKRDDPTQIDPSPLRPASSDDTETVFENVLGEFTLYLLLREFLNEGSALRASKGWDGDSITLLADSQGKETLLLSTIWDSDRDAEQFQTAYISLIKKKFPAIRLATSSPVDTESLPGEILTWEDDLHTVTFYSQGNRVDVVEMDR